MPSRPTDVYQDQGWIGWTHIFEIIKNSNQNGRQSEEIYEIQDPPDAEETHETRNQPDSDEAYENRDHSGLEQVLEIFNTMTYAQAQHYVINELGISEPKEFTDWLRSDEVPMNFPSKPHKFYSEWTSVKAFLKIQDVNQMTYQESKAYIQRLFIPTREEALKWLVSDERSDNFPANPKQFYKEEWEGWEEYLGLENRDVPKNIPQVEETDDADKELSLDME